MNHRASHLVILLALLLKRQWKEVLVKLRQTSATGLIAGRMPPKRVRRPAAKVIAAPKRRLRRPAAAGVDPAHAPGGAPALPLPGQEEPWNDVADLQPGALAVGERILAKVWYCAEEGSAHLEVVEETRDAEGEWLGVKVLGTGVHQLRTWVLTQASQPPRVYFLRKISKLEDRKPIPGVGYLLSYRGVKPADQFPWLRNCLDQEPPHDVLETGELRRLADQVEGGHPRDLLGPPQEVGERTSKKPKKEKKLSGRAKVKKMVEEARWTVRGTPLDVSYRKPIKLKLKKGKSSSGSTHSKSSSSSSGSSVAGLGAEHRLKAVARRLPGYLTRTAAKEAKLLLAESSGETQSGFQVFLRYYRQVIYPKGGPKGVQRELLTLATVLDQLQTGHILASMDVLCQRMKSLEMLLGGSEASMSTQLELIPRELRGLAGDSEARFAQREHHAESKLNKQLGQPRGPSGPSGKGPWKGQSKGGNPQGKGKKGSWDDRPNGAQKGQESRVMEVQKHQ